MRRSFIRGALKCALSSAAIIGLVVPVSPASAQAATVKFDIPATDLATALESFGKQSGKEIIFDRAQTAGKRSPVVSGALQPVEALSRLLKGSGLSMRMANAGTFVVEGAPRGNAVAGVPNAGGNQRASSLGEEHAAGAAAQDESEQQQAIVVTGTHIKGTAPVGSEIKSYSREDLDRSGAATVDQFARLMPENFSNNDPVSNILGNSQFARFSGAGANIWSGSSFNLRGLGPTATLTLLNGHRLAPSGADGSLVDSSQVPLSVIDHIDVMADGASAVYGADAVAGVVNMVTRTNFDGGETRVRYAGATDGGANEFTGSQLVGHSWSTGNALLSYEFDDQYGLDASQRNYIPSQGGPYSLLPWNRRNSVFFSGQQELGAATTIRGDAIYSDRAFRQQSFQNSTIEQASHQSSGNAHQLELTSTIEHKFGGQWRANLTGYYDRSWANSTDVSTTVFPTRTINSTTLRNPISNIAGADISADGSLAGLPGGDLKAAFGASFRAENFRSTQSTGAVRTIVPRQKRNVESLYAELLVPLIGETNAASWTRRLEFSAAVRYDNYSDFGSTTNPKFGAVWEPIGGIEFRGTYGTSYHAPLLSQLGSPVQYEALLLPSPSGVTDTLFQVGGNPSLRPETSKSYTIGLTFKPQAIPTFKLSTTYFNVKFRNRITTPPLVSIATIFTDPSLAPFVTLNPPLSLVQADFNSPGFVGDFSGGRGPAGVGAIFDFQYANIASTKETGLDLTSTYALQTQFGSLSFFLNADRLFKNDFQPSTLSPTVHLLDAFGQPPKWRARGGLSWNDRHLAASIFVNYTSGYQNTLLTPSPPIGSWTTGDLFLSYRTGETARSFALRDLTLSLSINNVTNQKPPFVKVPPSLPGASSLPFDPNNASPVGRLIAVELTKRW